MYRSYGAPFAVPPLVRKCLTPKDLGAHPLTDTGHNHTNCGQGLAGGLQLVVDGCVGLNRIETQASQEVSSFTIDRIHETALKTSRQ